MRKADRRTKEKAESSGLWWSKVVEVEAVLEKPWGTLDLAVTLYEILSRLVE